VEAKGVSVATYYTECRPNCYKITMHFEKPPKCGTIVIKIVYQNLNLFCPQQELQLKHINNSEVATLTNSATVWIVI
jgi:hypothetical protein